jgi:hypothetical protein
MHGNQMTKSHWFDELELLSRTCAWQRGEQILSHSVCSFNRKPTILAMAAGRSPG